MLILSWTAFSAGKPAAMFWASPEAVWRSRCGEELRHPANSHMTKASLHFIFQPQSSLRMTAAPVNSFTAVSWETLSQSHPGKKLWANTFVVWRFSWKLRRMWDLTVCKLNQPLAVLWAIAEVMGLLNQRQKTCTVHSTAVSVRSYLHWILLPPKSYGAVAGVDGHGCLLQTQ